LCGPLLRALARRLIGVDLSPGMLARAAERGYDELVEADIAAYCRAHPAEFDLLVAADVLVYIGALPPVFAAARTSLRKGGHFAFTLERGDGDDLEYRLNAGGRYTHGEGYARSSLAAAGFEVRSLTTATLRTELRVDVRGSVVLARAI
jgi:predicted TPR repeat methyltransferase